MLALQVIHTLLETQERLPRAYVTLNGGSEHLCTQAITKTIYGDRCPPHPVLQATPAAQPGHFRGHGIRLCSTRRGNESESRARGRTLASVLNSWENITRGVGHRAENGGWEMGARLRDEAEHVLTPKLAGSLDLIGGQGAVELPAGQGRGGTLTLEKSPCPGDRGPRGSEQKVPGSLRSVSRWETKRACTTAVTEKKGTQRRT